MAYMSEIVKISCNERYRAVTLRKWNPSVWTWLPEVLYKLADDRKELNEKPTRESLQMIGLHSEGDVGLTPTLQQRIKRSMN